MFTTQPPATQDGTTTSGEQTSLISRPTPNRKQVLARLEKSRRLLCVSHLFAKFSEVAWQFCLVLFLAAFANYESFSLVSTYGLFSGLCTFLAGSKVGQFIDRSDRLRVAQWFIWTQNASVLLATVCCYSLLSRDGGDGARTPATDESDEDGTTSGAAGDGWLGSLLIGVPTDPKSLWLLLGVHLLGAFANVLDQGFTVSIERDWVVVMSRLASSSYAEPTPLSSEVGEGGPPPISSSSDKAEDRNDDGVVKTATSATTDAAASAWLSDTNVALRQIDLSCKVMAPAIAGFFVAAFESDDGTNLLRHGSDLRGAAILVGAVNGAALVVEFICTAKIYSLIPDLAVKRKKNPRGGGRNDGGDETKTDSRSFGSASDGDNRSEERERTGASSDGEEVTAMEFGTDASSSDDGAPGSTDTEGKTDKDSESESSERGICRVPYGFRVYLDQSISWGGIALALLYLNILTFGAIMTAYLIWRGMRLETIGVWRGVSSAVGLLGTCAYGFSSRHATLIFTGMWSITFQFLCVTASYASLFVEDYVLSLSLLIIGVCSSRIGLWVFDMSVTQLMQETVPDGVRGVVGGVQQSLNAFFGLFSFGLGILFPKPSDFHVLVAAGYGGIALAVLLYGFGVYRRRDELK